MAAFFVKALLIAGFIDFEIAFMRLSFWLVGFTRRMGGAAENYFEC